MARDAGIETLVHDDLGVLSGLATKTMFGGLAWLQHGNLLCCARDDGLLVRLGKDRDGWALRIAGITPMRSQGRVMAGWVQCDPDICADDALRARLLADAVAFVRTLPAK